jgi:hypothetical protein
MDAALGEVQDSIERLVGPKKGAPAIGTRTPRAAAARRPYASCTIALTAADNSSPASCVRSRSSPRH